jgi:hypothetical protein
MLREAKRVEDPPPVLVFLSVPPLQQIILPSHEAESFVTFTDLDSLSH